MNVVMFQRMAELSENRSKFYKIKKLMHNWRGVVMLSIALFTLKIASEQLVLLLR